jgi:hypothetical protein
MAKSTHPWHLVHQAIQAGDETAARQALRDADERLSGRMRVSADQAIKNAFGRDKPEATRSLKERQKQQDESANQSSLAKSLKRRREDRQKKADARRERTKPNRGPNAPLGPIEEDHLYGKPDHGGFNLPVSG